MSVTAEAAAQSSNFDDFATAPSSSPNILYLLTNPFQKLLQQIHPTNHKLLHKLIRLFQLILQALVFLLEHLILIPQLYHLLLQIIVAINSSKRG